jgi:hypothetical protein
LNLEECAGFLGRQSRKAGAEVLQNAWRFIEPAMRMDGAFPPVRSRWVIACVDFAFHWYDLDIHTISLFTVMEN